MDDERAWALRLEQLGLAIQRQLASVADRDDFAQPVAFEGGDTIFAIDRVVEPIIEEAIEAWPAECKPLLLIAEGFGEDGRCQFGTGPLRFRLLVDPIDGTRGLMYDKRSAWFLAAIAHDRGKATTLADTFAAAMVELPTSKQLWCDSYLATSAEPTWGKRCKAGGDAAHPLPIRPSSASNLEFGFAQVSNFFPGTKVLASDLMERIAAGTASNTTDGQSLIFDDQYLSTGGQIAELIAGHDRFTCDLRPLFYEILEKGAGRSLRGVECHPYDVAGALVARQAGVIITDGFGAPLDCRLNVTDGVHWCGYANKQISQAVQPIIAEWLAERGIRGG